MLKIRLLVSLGHHGGRRKVASLRPPFSTPLRSLGEPDPETPFLVPIEHAPPLFVRIREDKISLKNSPAPLRFAADAVVVDAAAAAAASRSDGRPADGGGLPEFGDELDRFVSAKCAACVIVSTLSPPKTFGAQDTRKT